MTDQTDTSPDPSAAPSAAFTAGSFAMHRGHRVQITLVHDDGTADVQKVDQNDEPVLDANRQPQWTPKVLMVELT